jgi:methylenetetrahydrofolate--tRNA-(uracil-5-)-methyltransferase
VPGGEALAVDRDLFGETITKVIEDHPMITVVRTPFTVADVSKAMDQGPLILATGPLTSPDLSEMLAQVTGRKHLYFYDAVSPTVTAESLDRSIVFAQSRYGKGEGDDYLNCPFEKDSYYDFVKALVAAESATLLLEKRWRSNSSRQSSTSRVAHRLRRLQKRVNVAWRSGTLSRLV